jgi:hypothetical protein
MSPAQAVIKVVDLEYWPAMLKEKGAARIGDLKDYTISIET